MPSGREGFYYFSVYLSVESGEAGRFDLELNGEVVCSIELDQQNSAGDEGQASCSATTYVMEGCNFNILMIFYSFNSLGLCNI